MSGLLRRLRALGVAAGLIAAPAAAQTPDLPMLSPEQTAQVDATVAGYMQRTAAPGTAIAVVRDGATVYARGYGLADLDRLKPVTTDTVFRLASVSKPMTATAVLQLAERGKLSLDAPVGAYVRGLEPAVAALTLRDLLRHTGGVRTYRGEEFFNDRRCGRLADAVRVFGADPLDHAPGARQTYSTYGYTLLGLAVEAASGQRFVEAMRRQVFRPAGMRRTSADDPRAARHRAIPYVRLGQGAVAPARTVDNTCKIPGGGLAGSVEDVANFAAALQMGRLVGPAAYGEMLRNQLSPEVVTATLAGQTASPAWGYSLGFQTGTARRTEAVLHTGGGVGATTVLYLLPQSRTAVVALSNIENAGPDITRLADDIADAVQPPVLAAVAR